MSSRVSRSRALYVTLGGRRTGTQSMLNHITQARMAFHGRHTDSPTIHRRCYDDPHPGRVPHAGEPDRLELVDRLLRLTGLADRLSFCASLPLSSSFARDELRLRLRTGDRERDFDADRRDLPRLLFLPLRSEAELPLPLPLSLSLSESSL